MFLVKKMSLWKQPCYLIFEIQLKHLWNVFSCLLQLSYSLQSARNDVGLWHEFVASSTIDLKMLWKWEILVIFWQCYSSLGINWAFLFPRIVVVKFCCCQYYLMLCETERICPLLHYYNANKWILCVWICVIELATLSSYMETAWNLSFLIMR